MQKKLTTFIIAVTAFGAVMALPAPAYAANGWFAFGGGNFMSGIEDYLSRKFNLDKTQVMNAVENFHAEQQANPTPGTAPGEADIEARERKRLDVLVSQGKITADQENAIIAELAALRAKYPNQTVRNEEEWEARHQALVNDWKTWADANGIDPDMIRPFGYGGRFMGVKAAMMHHMWRDGITPTPTPS